MGNGLLFQIIHLNMSITLVIIIVTGLVSYQAFNNQEIFYKLLHSPYSVLRNKEYSRLITHGFVHGNWPHLIFNMYVLWMFGKIVENTLEVNYVLGKIYFVLIYFGGMIFATLPSLKKHQNNPNYNSVGASGAVSALVFSSILMNPLMKMGLLFIPVMIPAFIFGPLYLLAEYYLDKKNQSYIAHDAHIYGALFGLIATALIDYNILISFVYKVIYYIQEGWF